MEAGPADREYHARIARLVEYVESRPAERHSLDRLAAIAGFPPAHVRRVFFATIGEPLGSFVARVRSDGDPAARLTLPGPGELHDAVRDRGFSVEVVDVAQTDVVSVTVGNARSHAKELFSVYVELLEWLAANGVDEERVNLIGISHDDRELGETERVGFEWAASPVPQADLPGWLEARREPDLTVARVHVEGPLEDEDLAWQYLYRVWLPQSGLEPAAAPAREIYRRLPHLTGWRAYDLWCALPLVRRNHPSEESHA